MNARARAEAAAKARIDLLPLAKWQYDGWRYSVLTRCLMHGWLRVRGWQRVSGNSDDDYLSDWEHPEHSRTDDSHAFFIEANLELQRRLVALGWMCPWPGQVVCGQAFAAPGTWTLAGADLPWVGGRRLGTKWTPALGRAFVNPNGRTVLAARVKLSAAVERAGESVRFLEFGR